MNEIIVASEEEGQTLAAVLRLRLGLSWNGARTLCERGKVFVGDSPALNSAVRMRAGTAIVVRHTAPRPLSPRAAQALAAIVYEDSQVVVIDKPAGIMSVPYERDDSDTAMDLIRAAWRAEGRSAAEVTGVPLHTVHRIDKETSGLLLFAKTKTALRNLQTLWRQHDIERRYLCVVHGRLTDRRIASYFVEDRGDGLRGSVRSHMPLRSGSAAPVRNGPGKQAITHVQGLEFIGQIATLCAVTLETGKTHQIRIHLSEAGHPIIGEQVYIRDFLKKGLSPLPSPRLLLHAETLGFEHPSTGQKQSLHRPPPVEFMRALNDLRCSAQSQHSVANQKYL